MVSLVVCNPNKAKKEEEEKQKTDPTTPSAGQPARSPTPNQAAAPKQPEKPS